MCIRGGVRSVVCVVVKVRGLSMCTCCGESGESGDVWLCTGGGGGGGGHRGVLVQD